MRDLNFCLGGGKEMTRGSLSSEEGRRCMYTGSGGEGRESFGSPARAVWRGGEG